MTMRTSMLVLWMAAASQQALAATVTFEVVHGLNRIWPAYDGGRNAQRPNAADKIVHEFRVTTSSDILRIGDVVISTRAGLYNNAPGNRHRAAVGMRLSRSFPPWGPTRGSRRPVRPPWPALAA